MKIAIDLDGTALYHREFFREFMKAMQDRGHQVGILTSHNVKDKPEDLLMLEALDFPKPDFYIGKTDEEKAELKPTIGNNGTWKARMVEEHEIDYLFGDLDKNPNYLKAFREKFPDRIFYSFTDDKSKQEI